MFSPEILIDILRNFTLFMEIKAGKEIKVICRYQQYRAVGKMIERHWIPSLRAQRSNLAIA